MISNGNDRQDAKDAKNSIHLGVLGVLAVNEDWLKNNFPLFPKWIRELLSSGAYMPIRFLFWNVRGVHQASWPARDPALRQSIANLAASRQVDVFVIAEYAFADTDLIESLNGAGIGSYYAVPGMNPRIRLFSRLENARWTDLFNNPINNRMTAHTLQVGNSRSILLIGLHGRDRRSVPNEADRADYAQEIAADIRRLERDVGHNRTVVCGDFNMNPFEQGMVARRGLHALISQQMTKTIDKLVSFPDKIFGQGGRG